MEKRKERIRRLMIAGLSDREIKAQLVNPISDDPDVEPDKPLSVRQASRYIQQVKEEWAEEPRENINTAVNKYIESQMDIYRELRIEGSVSALKEASNILDKIAKIQSVFEEKDSSDDSDGMTINFIDSAETYEEAVKQLEDIDVTH